MEKNSLGENLFVASGLEGLPILKIKLAEDVVDEVCQDLPEYSGRDKFELDDGKTEGYAGSLVLEKANIKDDFTFCGSLGIEKN